MRRLGRAVLNAIYTLLCILLWMTSLPTFIGFFILVLHGETLGALILGVGYMLIFLPWLAIEKFLAPPKLPPPRRELVGSRGRSLGSVFKAIKEQDQRWRDGTWQRPSY